MNDSDLDLTQPTKAGEPNVTAAYQPDSGADELVRVLDRYMADLEAGRAPSREKLLAENPALASQLEPCLAGIEFIHRAARPADDLSAQLGDFAIVQEVGRGGMGVVYEAQQLSLKRKVALKVLRFAGVADRDAMERFQREAETVALLHHTNIVPIFAIGEQRGVFYYAMQFIEGRSLAAVLQKSQHDAAPIGLVELARWGLQAAEALAHAHQRNVIHRDVKPSNLILDPAGQVWLTDFGLAKRIDDVTLSMTGGLLGTPRYMSPEQASAARQPVDQRTDIYSLGATLYELATGKPLFDADSAHGIITQILTREPSRPRSVRTDLPRDLETIIVKCLAKEPSGRYATAQALADDLRAFCEGRAIKARRTSLAERALRWMKTRKKNVALAAITAAATLAIATVSYVAYHSLAEARLAHFMVSTATDEHFKVEVLDEAEHKTIATFTAPTQQSEVVPPGKYHVRLSRAGQLSETAQFEAAVGGSYNAIAALQSRNLWQMQLAYEETVEVARLDGRDDVFLAKLDELRRLHGGDAHEIWKISLTAKDQPMVEKAFHGLSFHWPIFNPNQIGIGRTSPSIVKPPLDLDGDGTPDLIWTSRSSAALVAISGKSGKVLWCHRCAAALPDKLREEDINSRNFVGPIGGNIVGEPLLAEVGGKRVVVSLCALNPETLALKKGGWVYGKPQLWLDAVDAQTGQPLWRRQLDWTSQAPINYVSYVATTWKLGGRTIGAIASENHLLGFDMLTGEPPWPDRELDARQPLVVRFADLRGNGEPAVLLVREALLAADVDHIDSRGRTANTEMRLTALSPGSPAPLWERSLKGVDYPLERYALGVSATDWDWPLVVDLDGAGKPEVVVPFVDYGNHACGVELLDGATGETHWKRRFSGAVRGWRPSQPERIVVGPDLDGDGRREIFAASYDEEKERMFVDALSGKDGRILWSHEQPGLYRNQENILPLRWWQPGADGWPLLVVAYGNAVDIGTKAQAIFLAASTGHVEHQASDFGAPEVFDLNGDGLPDLLVPDSRLGPHRRFALQLRAIKGTPPAVSRENRTHSRAADFNGDGYTDLLSTFDELAISGRDAGVLWKSSALQGTDGAVNPLPDSDLDGDGAPELLTIPWNYQGNPTAKVVATSGRDGKVLWARNLLMTEDNTFSFTNASPLHLAGHIFEAGKRPDVLVLYERQRHPRQAANSGASIELRQRRLARLGGNDGSIVWDQALDDFSALDLRDLKIPFAVADLDGDGIKDIVLWLPSFDGDSPTDGPAKVQGKTDMSLPEGKTTDGKTTEKPPRPLFNLCACSGRDGKLLWRRPGFITPEWSRGNMVRMLGGIPMPSICDRKGDGNPLVLITDQVLKPGVAAGFRTEVVALNGKSGKEKWSWSPEAISASNSDSANSGRGPLETSQAWCNASPQVVRTSAGPAIVVSETDDSIVTRVDPKTHLLVPTGQTGSRIVLLDMAGKLLQVTDDVSPEVERVWPKPARLQISIHDLLGDGKDVLAWCDGRRMRAQRPAEKELLWESDELPMPLNWYLFSIQPGGNGFPATVVVGNSNGMIGLAGPTGKMRWRCDAEPIDAKSLLKCDDPQGLPRIMPFHVGNMQASYRALATDDHGKCIMPKPAPRQYDASLIDGRLLRPLPWTRAAGMQENGAVAWIVYVIAFIALASIIGWWPGKLRRAAWFAALWIIPFVVIELFHFMLDARELGPSERFDWSHWSELSQQDFGILMAIFVLVVLAWWLVRITLWSVKQISTRIRRGPLRKLETR